MSIKEECIAIAAKVFADKGFSLNPTDQIENIFAYAATSADFAKVITSKNPKVLAELKAQVKYICSLGLDTAKGRKLVYVKTRNFNDAPKNSTQKNWITLPDITESYHALIHVLVRSEALKNIVVQHTYEGYEINYSGNIGDVPVIKSWATTPKDRGAYTGCFVTLYFPDGEIQTSYFHSSDIQRTHRAFSKSNSTWTAHEQSMTAKSAIMEAIRYIPVFDEVIASVVEHYDESHDFDKQEVISDNQLSNLTTMIDENGVDMAGLLKKYSIDSLDELPANRYEQCANTIKEVIGKAA